MSKYQTGDNPGTEGFTIRNLSLIANEEDHDTLKTQNLKLKAVCCIWHIGLRNFPFSLLVKEASGGRWGHPLLFSLDGDDFQQPNHVVLIFAVLCVCDGAVCSFPRIYRCPPSCVMIERCHWLTASDLPQHHLQRGLPMGNSSSFYFLFRDALNTMEAFLGFYQSL